VVKLDAERERRDIGSPHSYAGITRIRF